MANLFIDSNIWLQFYKLSNEKVDTLNELYSYVKDGKIKLIINSQVRDEIYRNRDKIVGDSLKLFSEFTFNIQVPPFMRDFDKLSDIKNNLKLASANHKLLSDRVKKDIDEENLNVDCVIKRFIDECGIHEIKDNQFKLAKKRNLLGNPPGKNSHTFGDELNWEFLLEFIDEGEDLCLVSGDRDYASPFNLSLIHPFLEKEWKRKKKSDLFFYRSLSSFFGDKIPEINLRNDKEIDDLIGLLEKSSNFAETHSIIGKFSKNNNFNDRQIIRLINAFEENNQINWIESDMDVAEFFKPIRERYDDIHGNE